MRVQAGQVLVEDAGACARPALEQRGSLARLFDGGGQCTCGEVHLRPHKACEVIGQSDGPAYGTPVVGLQTLAACAATGGPGAGHHDPAS